MLKETVQDYNALDKLAAQIMTDKQKLESSYSHFHNAKPAPRARAMAAKFSQRLGVLALEIMEDIRNEQKDM